MVETASGTQGLIFAQILNAQVWEFFAGILDEVAEDAFVVVSNENDLAKTRDFGDSFERVGDDRVPGDFKQWLC